MRRMRRLILTAAAGFFFCSGGGFKATGGRLEGNRLHGGGRYEEAAASYLGVGTKSFETVLRFDLANVYARLGEYAAAAELYAQVRKTGDPSICRAAWYNEGVLLYEKGRYAEAYRAFRSALALDPRDSDARVNLELAYRDWQRREAAPPERAAPAQRSEGGEADEELRLLRRLETGRYKLGGEVAAQPSPEDY